MVISLFDILASLEDQKQELISYIEVLVILLCWKIKDFYEDIS